ncbi:hypothetical protein FBUS_08448 [Fasciolopsis buskii]|uniref:Uncharacterized protein n=1 Tax=Fasciolopsis buskii TaxID=27845 RepID=A0A8E0S0S6_9TREM|nr:hypothetical protein FBUS_08448 [Fasciolopsis buski]
MQVFRRVVTSRTMLAQHIFRRVKERMSETGLGHRPKTPDETVSYSTHQGVTEIIILVNSRPFLVERINGKQLITALFIYASNFLTWPFPLSDIRILHCCELDAVVVIISLDCVQYKRKLLPHGRSHVFYF